MKVLTINGSPNPRGCTARALTELEQALAAEGVEYERIEAGNKEIRGCVACGFCRTHGRCVFNDIVNEVAPKFAQADAIVVGTPVYYASANGTTMSFLHRLFYSTPFDKTMKVGAAVAVARRGGLTATYDELNKMFGISGMPIASGQYWNGVHGALPGEAGKDTEGMQQMRTLANNMVFLMKSIALGKEKFGIPEKEPTTFTNFVR